MNDNFFTAKRAAIPTIFLMLLGWHSRINGGENMGAGL